jgi:hypothetical protein
LRPDGDHTAVAVVTDLDVTGKPAQFGRGVMADVSKRILDQFATNLAREIQSGSLGTVPARVTEAAGTIEPPSLASSPSLTRPVVPVPVSAPVESLDVLALLKEPAKRAAPPLAAGAVLGLLLGWRLASRSGRR